jgi:tetratricopeptide (TPR) repeat protein
MKCSGNFESGSSAHRIVFHCSYSRKVCLQRALAEKEKTLGLEHMTLNTIHNLGNLYWKQGKLAEAEVAYQRVLAGKEKTLGPEHMSTLNTVNNLGGLYTDQGKLAEAEAIC